MKTSYGPQPETLQRLVPLTTSMEELETAGKACAGVLMPRSVAHSGWAACLLRGNSCPALTGTAKWHCSSEPLQISAHKRHHDPDFLLTNISKTPSRNYTWHAEEFQHLAHQSSDSLPNHKAGAERHVWMFRTLKTNFVRWIFFL